jgi:hypothetical protein
MNKDSSAYFHHRESAGDKNGLTDGEQHGNEADTVSDM